tara:strand:+ start:1268 stop:1906 length:639 start_codon:yes stop_codon:yes gene_type:complete
MKKLVEITKVITNPRNPRVIKNDKFEQLKHSITTLPSYMKLRPVIVDEDMMVLGGNMRLKASLALGKTKIWTDMFTQEDCDYNNKLAEEENRKTKTYLEYCDEIMIKDNTNAGQWEWDILGNEWDSTLLKDYGLDVWQNVDDLYDVQKNTEEDEDKKPKITDDEYSLFELIMQHDNKVKFLSVLSGIKKKYGTEKMEEALIIMINKYIENEK